MRLADTSLRLQVDLQIAMHVVKPNLRINKDPQSSNNAVIHPKGAKGVVQGVASWRSTTVLYGSGMALGELQEVRRFRFHHRGSKCTHQQLRCSFLSYFQEFWRCYLDITLYTAFRPHSIADAPYHHISHTPTDILSIDRLFSKNGRMPGGAGRRTSTSFEAINASSATGIPNLVRYSV